ncbi:sensor histidine kinase [Evansella sp. AB-rgal1]|uniref:sensor histidine kinase n=1 Tax=Evansella sp. AB-rgal1 TaxID=3242696 RepID=UPI00359E555B
MIFKMRKFSNLKLRSKLIVTYILLTVIPLSLLGYISYQQYTRSIEEQVGEYIPKLLAQANENIANQVKEIKRLPNLLYSSSHVIEVLRKDAHQNLSFLLQDEFTVNSYLTRTYINGGNKDILGVFILSKNRVFQSVTIPHARFDLAYNGLPYGQNMKLQGTEDIFILPYQTSLQFEGNPPYILLMRQLTDFENRTNLGTMLIAIEVSFLGDIVKKLNDDGKAAVWLNDENGRIIYHTDAELIGAIDYEIHSYPSINGSFRTMGDDNNLISLHRLDETGWTLGHSISVKNLTSRTDLVRNVTIILFIAIILFSTVISILLAWNVTKPLNHLTSLMKSVEKGDFDINLSINSKDEVGALANSFNSMVLEIKNLIREKYQIELKQKEAELYALQSQINPHFMYNTLETVAMSVEDDDKDTVVKMVTLLGRMLRFSISTKETVIPISEELLHMKDYLTIQKIRFEDKVTFTFCEKLNAKSFYTPKFILQPIVENAVKYGLVYGRITTIDITVELSHDTNTDSKEVVFRVKDSGPGINPEALDKLKCLLKSNPMTKRESGFGLLNVNARIQMKFGSQYGLELFSEVGEGTEVVIRIPALTARNEVGSYEFT